MPWNYIMGPLVGAVIGYITNDIAVKMLFRPLRPVKIGRFTLPFTPGIIPKNKARIGQAIAKAIQNSLLTEEMITETFLSESMCNKVKENINNWYESQLQNTMMVKDLITNYVDPEKYNQITNEIRVKLTINISNKIKSMEFGNIVAEEVVKAAKDKVQGTMLSFMMTDAILQPIAKQIGEGVDTYLDKNAAPLVRSFVDKEMEQMEETSIGKAIEKLDPYKEALEEAVLSLYTSLVNQYMSKIIIDLNISKMVEEKVNQMAVEEVEELVLSIMKNELSAVVNLGAVLGFIIGMINVFF